ncbi:hypothetical protein BDN72DRAFT_851782 [Pluteus cervinus]|uniref:Uncharacterized protein n=2 Tax=Pluteus cervinus TaxID=181527 RepID=A0ACD2ZY12_9AGAR|nr:hypothetical protein BDN72DRAFT_851805 [Pluteus cervinus]TFK58337.1 hypothetical protein BDN72DRAFT_851782 [Pluteus cervinus]
MHHHVNHVRYINVTMPPEALEVIEEQVAWLTPSAMVAKICLDVRAARIYSAWREHSQTHWRHDDLQLPSAKQLYFCSEVHRVPEGVEILTWGMSKIAELKGRVIEVAMDAR